MHFLTGVFTKLIPIKVHKEELSDNVKVRYKILGIKLLTIRINSFYTIYSFLSCKKIRMNSVNPMLMEDKHLLESTCTCQTKLFFDLSWGGGTESYFYQKRDELLNSHHVIRVQYISAVKQYKVTLYKLGEERVLWKCDLQQLKLVLQDLVLEEIIVNNLVGYPNPFAILDMITHVLKKNNVKVSARGHDFGSICPSFTLMRNDNFCGGPKTLSKCIECNPSSHLDDKVDIQIWRQRWSEFYHNTADQLIVFSQSSYDLFIMAYPNIKNIITVVPHRVLPLRVANIELHQGINIAILGNISSIPKGINIVKELEELITQEQGVHFIIVGDYKTKNKQTQVIGSYQRDDLPRIMEENNIDIIFIPSIWPETFSYTTSEAILMQLPVACFNIGAPAQRISKYENGLVIPEMNAKSALKEMIHFIEERKK